MNKHDSLIRKQTLEEVLKQVKRKEFWYDDYGKAQMDFEKWLEKELSKDEK